MPSGGGDAHEIVDDLSPNPTPDAPFWFGYYGYVAWDSLFDLSPPSAGAYGHLASRDLGIAFDYPATWSLGAQPMPYASCNLCTVVGPMHTPHPYGIQLYKDQHHIGCQLTCYLNIRALPKESTRTIDANEHVALQQEFERQRPLGLVNEDGDTTSYREILTVVPLASIAGLPPEAEVPAVFIDAFYRYGDASGEAETRAALSQLLGSLELSNTP